MPAARSPRFRHRQLILPHRCPSASRSIGRRVAGGVASVLMALSAASDLQADPPTVPVFAEGTRFAAVGDSITHGGWCMPYVDLYYLTRFPDRRLDIFNCGINGDGAGGGSQRYPWDIAPLHPNIVSVMFGMNDVGRDLYALGKSGDAVQNRRLEQIDNYEHNLRELVTTLQKDKIRVVVLSPTIYDDTAEGPAAHSPGLNDGLGICTDRAAKVAAELNCPMVDFYHPMLAVTTEQQKTNPKFSMIGNDRVHPHVLGQLFMAYHFLKAQHVPAEVASVSLDGKSGRATRTSNCQADEIRVADGGISYRYLAKSLPFPIERWTNAVAGWCPLVDDLDREMLQVTNLAPGDYQLTIDGKAIRNYSATELTAGVNLAWVDSNTPQMAQAAKVWFAYKKNLESVFKLRTIAFVERAAFKPDFPQPATLEQMGPRLDAYVKSLAGSPWEKSILSEVDKYRACKADEVQLRAQVEKMREEMRALAQPVAHQVKLTPVKS